MKKNIVIIGAGIAGCSLAHFLAQDGWHVTILEAEENIAQGGSGNPVAAIYPKFMLNDEAHNHFMLKSFAFTTAWINQIGLKSKDYGFNGAIEFLDKEYAQKMAFNLSKDISFRDKIFDLLSPSLLQKYLFNKDSSGLFFHQGGWVNPIALCHHLVDHKRIKVITHQKMISIKKIKKQWVLQTKDRKIFNVTHVAICNATQINQFNLTAHLDVDAFRGQINWVSATSFDMPPIVSCDTGYLAPPIHGQHIFGATYAMNDFEKNLRLSDTKKNIASIKEIHNGFYKHCLMQPRIEGRVAWRASTKDRKPYVCQIFDDKVFKKMRVRELANPANLPWLDNFYVASGFGSRGFTFAPYCAYVLSHLINKNLSQEDKETLNYTNPERYRLKKMSLKKVASRIF